MELIKRWESRRGKYWLALYKDGEVYRYQGDGCGGSLGRMDRETALTEMERRVALYRWDGINLAEKGE